MKFKVPTHFGNNRQTDRPGSVFSKIAASLFFLIFAGMGSLFLVLVIREVARGKAEWTLLFFLIIPLIFILVGAAGIYGTWRKKDPSKISKAKFANRQLGKRGMFLFGAVFVIIGLGLTYVLLIRPLVKTWQARRWTETPCRIISAEVGEHSSDDGMTYSIDITYEYKINGSVYHCSRYDFIGGSSGGYNSKKAVVDSYLQADNPVCYVNPDDASEAVLVRDLTAKNAIGLFPLIFVAAGVAVCIAAVRHKTATGRAGWLPSMKRAQTLDSDNPYVLSQNQTENQSDSITLNPDATPLKKLGVIILFCLFWNGIVSVFAYQAVQGFRTGHPEWFLTIFLIPFVLVGLGFVGAVIYQLLALFNPQFRLTLQPGILYPGSAVQFEWQGAGKVDRIRQLNITLTGREEATYRVGTNTRTAKNTFFTMELFNTSRPDEIAQGQIGFAVPEDTMHSFAADHNKIIWTIKIHGDIARWPDTSQEYTITISPLPIGQENRQ